MRLFLGPQHVNTAVNTIINGGDIVSAYWETAELILDVALTGNPASVVLLQTQEIVKYWR